MIEFKNVRKEYSNGTVALDNVNLTINDGEFVFIVGESGAGKTTLTSLLLREEKVTSGELLVDGADISKMPKYRVPKYRRTIGFIFQNFRLFEKKTVYENVDFAMQVIGVPKSQRKKRVLAMLHIVGLEDKVGCYPRELSGGEQQRVAIARAIVNNPSTIIADEPTGNIDPQLSIEIMNMLMSINKLGKTVLVVTHEKSLVDHYHQRVVRLHSGKVFDDRVGGMFE